MMDRRMETNVMYGHLFSISVNFLAQNTQQEPKTPSKCLRFIGYFFYGYKRNKWQVPNSCLPNKSCHCYSATVLLGTFTLNVDCYSFAWHFIILQQSCLEL